MALPEKSENAPCSAPTKNTTMAARRAKKSAHGAMAETAIVGTSNSGLMVAACDMKPPVWDDTRPDGCISQPECLASPQQCHSSATAPESHRLPQGRVIGTLSLARFGGQSDTR